MAVIDTRMKGWVKLPSDAIYNQLKTNGTYTQDGRTITYDECTVYLTPDTGIGGTGLEGNRAVITNASGDVINSGVSSTELSYLTNARKNLQEQIDDLYNKIGTAAAGVYVLDTLDQLLASTDTPGTYYVPDAYGTYYQYLIDNEGKIQLIGTGIPPEEIGQQDLAAYQKKADPTLQVRDKNTNAVIGTVVGSINALDQEIGQSYPLKTVNQTITAAINGLADRESGNVQIVGTNRISVTSTPLPDGSGNKYTIGHINDGLTNSGTLGAIINGGRATVSLNTSWDSFGHVLKNVGLPTTLYIPSEQGSADGQVWSWDATNQRGVWKTVTANGSYSASKGIKIDGTDIQHTVTGKAAIVGSVGQVLTAKIDDNGHVLEFFKMDQSGDKYLSADWKANDPIVDANDILNMNSPKKLVSVMAINDIMGGMRLKKCTQAQYDADTAAGAIKSDTVYIIVN